MTASKALASGIRVVEIGSSQSVALAGMTLADAGADVIAIEKPGGGPLRDEPAYQMWARGKRAVEIDLAAPEGKDRAESLIRDADVVLIGMKPASVDRLGLEFAKLGALSPNLIVVYLTGFGLAGPYRDVPVYDGVMQARGGRMYDFSTLHDGARPAFAAAPVASHGAAMAIVSGVYGALRKRALAPADSKPAAQLVETTMARALAVYDLVGWIPGGPPPLRTEDVPFLPYTVARTQDGVWIQFAQNGPALFADFLRVVGLEGEIDYLDAMIPVADNEVKRRHRSRVQAKIAEHPWSHWQDVFASERNLSAEPFHAPGEALGHAQFEAIGDVVTVPGLAGQETRQLGPVFELREPPLEPAGPAPERGRTSVEFRPRPARSAVSEPPTAPTGNGPGLLAGTTILELGMWIALPFAATQLAELGARVIKLEPIEGDPMRTTGPVAFKIVQGKESLTLDLKQDRAREIVHRLVREADAVLHSYRPGVPERLGIDFETLRALNPKLVYVYNGSYGSRGPKRNAPAFHVTGGAVAGGAYAQAGAGCPPPADVALTEDEVARISRRLELANEANPDFNSAVTATAATIMGLYGQATTGEAYEIETRMMLSNAMMMSADFIDWEGRPPRREVDSDLNGLGPLYRLYRAAEGWVFVAAPQPRDFARLCEALDLAAMAEDARFADATGRARHADALAQALGEAIAKRPADELERRLTECGIACMRADEGPYRTWLFEQDWALASGDVVDVEDSIGGPYRRYGAPFVAGEEVTLRGADAAGAQSRSLLREAGYSDDEIESMIADGVVGTD